MTRPAILALDLSLSAVGIAEPDGRLSTYKTTDKGDHRLHDIASKTIHLAVTTKADLVVLEAPFVGVSGSTTLKLGMLHGAVRFCLLRFKLQYLMVPPAVLKMYATGRGLASKPDLRMELYKRTSTDVADDNQVDAAWLRLLGLDLCGHPELVMPEGHRRALKKLALPAEVAA